MKYYIYCKTTHKLLAIYTNKETLKSLDLSKCYYNEVSEKKITPKKSSTPSRHSIESKNHKSQENVSNDSLMSPTNPIYHSLAYGSHSSCNSSGYSDSSSSSCSDSSSSSCSSSCD